MISLHIDSSSNLLEQEIWYLLFSTHSAENLKMVTELLKDEFIPLQKFLRFIKKWFETSMKTSKVIEAYDHIAKVKTKRSDEDRHTQYYILKMAKQKVLSFELDKKYSPLPETKEEKTEIKNFLDCSFSIFSCFHQTASRKIYEKMQLNRQKALWQYQSEEKKVEKIFYKKHKI